MATCAEVKAVKNKRIEEEEVKMEENEEEKEKEETNKCWLPANIK
jgi:hypothetical protein